MTKKYPKFHLITFFQTTSVKIEYSIDQRPVNHRGMLGQRVREYNICKHLCHVCTHQYDIGHDDDDASDENDYCSVKAFLSCFYF